MKLKFRSEMKNKIRTQPKNILEYLRVLVSLPFPFRKDISTYGNHELILYDV